MTRKQIIVTILTSLSILFILMIIVDIFQFQIEIFFKIYFQYFIFSIFISLTISFILILIICCNDDDIDEKVILFSYIWIIIIFFIASIRIFINQIDENKYLIEDEKEILKKEIEQKRLEKELKNQEIKRKINKILQRILYEIRKFISLGLIIFNFIVVIGYFIRIISKTRKELDEKIKALKYKEYQQEIENIEFILRGKGINHLLE